MSGQLIVCESQGMWTALLRRDTPHLGVKVVEVRRHDEALGEIDASPAAFLVAEVTPKNLAEIPGRLSVLSRRFPRTPAAVVAGRELHLARPWLWECGAVWVTVSLRELPLLIRVVERHFGTPDDIGPRWTRGAVGRLPWEGTTGPA